MSHPPLQHSIGGFLRGEMLRAGFGPQHITHHFGNNERILGHPILSLVSHDLSVGALKIESQVVYGDLYVDEQRHVVVRSFVWDEAAAHAEIRTRGMRYVVNPPTGFYRLPVAQLHTWLAHLHGAQIAVPTFQWEREREYGQPLRRLQVCYGNFWHGTAHSWGMHDKRESDINTRWQAIWDAISAACTPAMAIGADEMLHQSWDTQ